MIRRHGRGPTGVPPCNHRHEARDAGIAQFQNESRRGRACADMRGGAAWTLSVRRQPDYCGSRNCGNRNAV